VGEAPNIYHIHDLYQHLDAAAPRSCVLKVVAKALGHYPAMNFLSGRQLLQCWLTYLSYVPFPALAFLSGRKHFVELGHRLPFPGVTFLYAYNCLV
jgi:hypothetical protein